MVQVISFNVKQWIHGTNICKPCLNFLPLTDNG